MGRAALVLFLAGAATYSAALAQDAAPNGTMPASALDDFPHADISNGLISARVFLPTEQGAYQGTRFDHAGVVLHIVYKGQDYSQYWFERYATNPYDVTDYHDNGAVQHACCATSGPVEEFAPVGFDEAGPCREAANEKTCGRFLKIGVGILKRDTDAYNQFPTYRILDAGTRSTAATPTEVRFTHDISGDPSGYGYSYVKTVRLTPGKAQMTIDHVLKNTGSKPIVTTVYNHNFLTLSPGNEHVQITAPFALNAEKPLQLELAQVEGRMLRYVAAVPLGQTVTSPITGFGQNAGDYDFRVENTATGFGERIRADQPIDRINFWSVHTVLGWEPYIAIALKPGEEKRWTYTYDYFARGKQ